MKIKPALFVFFLLVCSCSCKQQEQKTASFLHSAIELLPIDKDKNIIIYSINPNDCINCLYGFTEINDHLEHAANAKLYVMYVEREVEKNDLIRTTKNIPLRDSVNRVIVWNKELFMKTLSYSNAAARLSTLTIYNYKSDSVIYSQPVKYIPDARKLDVFLENK